VALPTAAACLLLAQGCASKGAGQAGADNPQRPESLLDLPAHEFIHTGMEAKALQRLVGRPSKVERRGETVIWYYEFGAVILEGGEVRYKFPPARAETPVRSGP
jgi:hypothetical protein